MPSTKRSRCPAAPRKPRRPVLPATLSPTILRRTRRRLEFSDVPGQHGGTQRNLLLEFDVATGEGSVTTANNDGTDDGTDSERASTQNDSEFLAPVPLVGFHPALGSHFDDMDIPEFSADFDWPLTLRDKA